jgi:hypothetical protein
MKPGWTAYQFALLMAPAAVVAEVQAELEELNRAERSVTGPR